MQSTHPKETTPGLKSPHLLTFPPVVIPMVSVNPLLKRCESRRILCLGFPVCHFVGRYARCIGDACRWVTNLGLGVPSCQAKRMPHGLRVLPDRLCVGDSRGPVHPWRCKPELNRQAILLLNQSHTYLHTRSTFHLSPNMSQQPRETRPVIPCVPCPLCFHLLRCWQSSDVSNLPSALPPASMVWREPANFQPTQAAALIAAS